MTPGAQGVSGSGPELFDQPTRARRPERDIFVTDSHRNGKNNAWCASRRNGTFVKDGAGRDPAGESSASRTHDREGLARTPLRRRPREHRIQISTRTGLHRRGAPVRTAERHRIAKDDTIYVADSESGPDTARTSAPASEKGSASQREGRIGDGVHRGHGATAPVTQGAEASASTRGNVYGGVVRRQMLERHVKK